MLLAVQERRMAALKAMSVNFLVTVITSAHCYCCIYHQVALPVCLDLGIVMMVFSFRNGRTLQNSMAAASSAQTAGGSSAGGSCRVKVCRTRSCRSTCVGGRPAALRSLPRRPHSVALVGRKVGPDASVAPCSLCLLDRILATGCHSLQRGRRSQHQQEVGVF